MGKLFGGLFVGIAMGVGMVVGKKLCEKYPTAPQKAADFIGKAAKVVANKVDKVMEPEAVKVE